MKDEEPNPFAEWLTSHNENDSIYTRNLTFFASFVAFTTTVLMRKRHSKSVCRVSAASKQKRVSLVTPARDAFPWCSGYHVRFTKFSALAC